MPRDPAPATNMEFAGDFLAAYREAVLLNPAIHDGAVLLRRELASMPYSVAAWSMRLFPPPKANISQTNRGSAFNSCLEMSCISEVDCMYLVSDGRLILFKNGQIHTVS